MARTKNRGFQQTFLSLLYDPALAAGRIYPAFQRGFEKRKRTISNSVKNQRDLLNDFYQTAH